MGNRRAAAVEASKQTEGLHGKSVPFFLCSVHPVQRRQTAMLVPQYEQEVTPRRTVLQFEGLDTERKRKER